MQSDSEKMRFMSFDIAFRYMYKMALFSEVALLRISVCRTE